MICTAGRGGDVATSTKAKPVGPIKRTWLRVIKHTLNPVAMRTARAGWGPISLVRHVGRKSGTRYETPLILARAPGGFVAELTYGPQVAWYRNVTAAGHCEIVYKGRTHRISAIEPYSTEEGLRAYGFPFDLALRLLRRHDFRFLREEVAGSGTRS
jgi:deazaflavin-dependent oxidoreductase (nitroreductase family)